MKKIKTTLVGIIMLLSMVALPGLAVSSVAAQDIIGRGLCSGAELGVDPADCPDEAGAAEPVNRIIRLIINIFSLIVGVVAVIMIIIGGLKYITSTGDSGNITSAKNTILYAIVGLVIVALAQVIVRFVLTQTTS